MNLDNNKTRTPAPLYQWYSVYMATVEVGLGAILHAARIPLTGYMLSLFQAFCLSRASRYDRGLLTPIYVSTTVAILKTLSPMGKKLTPMLAIISQGILFNVGTLCLGNNIVGHMLGAVLLSFWGFIQPALLSYIIFGQDLLAGLRALETMVTQYLPGFSLWMVLVGVVFLKGILAVFTMILAKSSLPLETFIHEKLTGRQTILQQNEVRKSRTIMSSLFKDLTSLWFLFSMMTVAVFSWWREDLLLPVFFTMTGYLAYSILLFLALRLLNLQKLVLYLEHLGLYKISSNMQNALLLMKASSHKQDKVHAN